MIYAEYTMLCIIAPLLIGALLLRGGARRFIVFYGLGAFMCLLAAYINGYAASVLAAGHYANLSQSQIMVQVTPICEEAVKALPVFFLLAVTRPKRKDVIAAAIAVGLGFATLENISYLIRYNDISPAFVLARGLSAGVTHTVCAAVLGYGCAALRGRGKLTAVCAFGLLCLAITYHGVYNLLVASSGVWRTAGYVMPISTAGVILFVALWNGDRLYAE